MDQPHPIVQLIESEHNYSRPWYKKLNVNQKYPNRLTRFLYLKNFPRHFQSRYPFAFSSNYDGTIDVGTPQDLQYQGLTEGLETDIIPVDEENNEQENEPTLDNSMWTQQMDRLYFKVLQILQQYYLSKLVYENLPNGALRMVNLMENTGLQFRHSFANIAGWDNELLIWLHNLFTTRISSHEHLIPIYHQVMQYLCKRLPSLIGKFYPTTPITSAATTPVHPASGQRNRQPSNSVSVDDDPGTKSISDGVSPRRLTSNPLILLVPSDPNIPSQPKSSRMENWKTLLSSMGQLINLNIPYRPDHGAADVIQTIKTSIKDKIRDTRRKKFNELRPLILVGFNQGSLLAVHCALENPGQVSAIICLGFPLQAINGFRGDLDDPILDLNIPVLFVIGQQSSTVTLDSMERLRENMVRSDTGLVIVGGANDKLIMCFKKRLNDGVTQSQVDKSIANEIHSFVSSIEVRQPSDF